MRDHIYQMLYKSILREKVRPERLNRGVFLATNDRLFFVTGTKGWCSNIRDEGMTKSYSNIYLILLWLSTTHRPPLCRARKKEGDDSDPPQKWGGHAAPRRRAMWHTYPGTPRGSLSSVFIPAGRLGNQTNRSVGSVPFPSRQMISDWSSPSRDRLCLASLPGLCCGPIQRDGGLQGNGGAASVLSRLGFPGWFIHSSSRSYHLFFTFFTTGITISMLPPEPCSKSQPALF